MSRRRDLDCVEALEFGFRLRRLRICLRRNDRPTDRTALPFFFSMTNLLERENFLAFNSPGLRGRIELLAAESNCADKRTRRDKSPFTTTVAVRCRNHARLARRMKSNRDQSKLSEACSDMAFAGMA